MKSTSHEKIQTKTKLNQEQASARPAGLTMAPPAYGIDFVDRGLDQAQAQPVSGVELGVVQRVRDESQSKGATSAKAKNKTGLPDKLKAGIEHLSGLSLDDVKVHYNSPKPTHIQAAAYAQGTDIHLGPGQQKHLPHEAWHVVQQKQGRVQATWQTKGLAINDEPGLETEADAMGAKAMKVRPIPQILTPSTAQMRPKTPENAAPVPTQLSTVPLVQRKSRFTSNSRTHGKKDTPITSLHNTFGKYYQQAGVPKGVPEVYIFKGLSQSVNYPPNNYQAQYEKADVAEAEIDPASVAKASGSNRNNAIIIPYGHLGVMERAIFDRPNIGNIYDGGHLVEHTLMEGTDADVEGNLAPQENKHFNQSLMRAWESVPEAYMHMKKTFIYRVQVEYQQQTYQRTGQQLATAGIFGHMYGALNSPDRAKLDGETPTFERWIPVKWTATVTDPTGNNLPQLTVTRGSHWQSVMSTQGAAEGAVIDSTNQAPNTGPGLRRSNSGMLAGFIETAGVHPINPKTALVGGQPTFGAYMYQPDPQDRADQPTYTANTGAYGNSSPATLPTASPTINLLSQPVDFSQLSEDIHKAINGPGGGGTTPTTGGKKKGKGKKPSRSTLNKTIDGIVKKNTTQYAPLRTSYLINADQGGAFIRIVDNHRLTKGSKLSKADLTLILQELVKQPEFTKQQSNRLLNLPYDPNMT